jgi:3-oxoadipate enol-lactonase
VCAVARRRGFDQAYDDVGEGAAVVLLHGFPFDRSMWREQVEALRGLYRVIAPDLRGHGESGAPEGPALMEEMARDVAALLDGLRIGRAALVGLSMGGYVTLAFLRLFPERASALVLADTRAQADTEEGGRAREENAVRVTRDGMKAIAETMLPKLLAAETFERRPDVVERVREMILRNNPVGAAAALRGMAARRDQTDLLPSIGAPALVVVGAEDAVTPPADAERLRDGIRDSRLVVIEGAAHLSNVERPEAFNSALLDFLEGCQKKGCFKE